MKIDELQWKEHLDSTDRLQKCKEEKHEIAISFFELVFNTYFNRNGI